DKIAQGDGAPVSQLAGPHAKLVSAITMGDRFGTDRETVARQQLGITVPAHPASVHIQQFGHVVVEGHWVRGFNGRWLLSRVPGFAQVRQSVTPVRVPAGKQIGGRTHTSTVVTIRARYNRWVILLAISAVVGFLVAVVGLRVAGAIPDGNL